MSNRNSLKSHLPGHQIHFYSIPSLDHLSIKPIRNVITFAVDDHHLKRPPASTAPAGVNLPVDAVDFCVIKRTGIALYTLKDRLSYIRVRILENNLPYPMYSSFSCDTGCCTSPIGWGLGS